MIKRIIIEGPDCSGKSTVVERIKNMLHWDSKSLHHIEGDQFERYLKEYANNLNTVFDRSHISEIVYSILWNRANPFSPDEQKMLNDICNNKVLIIFVCPDIEVIKSRYLNRKFEQQISFNELEKSREIFIEVMGKLPFLLYQSKDYEELDSLLKSVREIIN